MMLRNFLLALPFASVIALTVACSGGDDSTSSDATSRLEQCSEEHDDAGPTSQDRCGDETDEAACLGVDGCAWSADTPTKCIYVGQVRPLSASKPCPNACVGRHSESSCLSVGVCGWDGSLQRCEYVGKVVPL